MACGEDGGNALQGSTSIHTHKSAHANSTYTINPTAITLPPHYLHAIPMLSLCYPYAYTFAHTNLGVHKERVLVSLHKARLFVEAGVARFIGFDPADVLTAPEPPPLEEVSWRGESGEMGGRGEVERR